MKLAINYEYFLSKIREEGYGELGDLGEGDESLPALYILFIKQVVEAVEAEGMCKFKEAVMK